jgi:hypothetical protein
LADAYSCTAWGNEKEDEIELRDPLKRVTDIFNRSVILKWKTFSVSTWLGNETLKSFQAITLLGNEVLLEVSGDHVVRLRGAEKNSSITCRLKFFHHSLTRKYGAIYLWIRRKIGQIVIKKSKRGPNIYSS